MKDNTMTNTVKPTTPNLAQKAIAAVTPQKTARGIMSQFVKARDELLKVVEREEAAAKNNEKAIMNLQSEAQNHRIEAELARRYAANVDSML